MLLRFIRTHSNVHATQHNLFAATAKFIGNAISDIGHIGHAGNPDEISVTVKINRFHALVNNPNFNLRWRDSRNDGQIQTWKSSPGIHMHPGRKLARHFEHLRYAKNVIWVVWRYENDLHFDTRYPGAAHPPRCRIGPPSSLSEMWDKLLILDSGDKKACRAAGWFQRTERVTLFGVESALRVA